MILYLIPPNTKLTTADLEKVPGEAQLSLYL